MMSLKIQQSISFFLHSTQSSFPIKFEVLPLTDFRIFMHELCYILALDLKNLEILTTIRYRKNYEDNVDFFAYILYNLQEALTLHRKHSKYFVAE